MLFTCNICNYNFKKKQSLQIHLIDKRCKSHLLNDLYLLHQYIGKFKSSINFDNNENICIKIIRDDVINPDKSIQDINYKNVIEIQN